jgi:MFS family permease
MKSGGMTDQRREAFQFIILLGVVSLFGDITYEGARGVSGPYLKLLGAGAVTIGLVAGLSEFVGYGLRLISGYLADRTEGYWTLTIIGYGLILSIPVLAFVGDWQLAAVFIILERLGKAIRSPARDTILSYATKSVGRGLGFGIHEALDQVGAIIGPLIFSGVLLLEGSYRDGFRILWLPAFLALATLLVARRKEPMPTRFDIQGKTDEDKLPRTFWLYSLFILLSVAGFPSFLLISYHFKARAVVSDIQIPMFYAVAMGVDALVAPVIGKIYDRVGLQSLMTIPVFTIFIPIFCFSQIYIYGLVGIVLWGTAVGIHETIMRAAIADLTPMKRRGTAYGIFNLTYGIAWFLGAPIMGLLYDFSISYLIGFVALLEFASILVLLSVKAPITGPGRQKGKL